MFSSVAITASPKYQYIIIIPTNRFMIMFAAVATITSVSSFQDDEVVPRKRGDHVEVLIRMLKSATQQKEAILRKNLIMSPNSKKKLSFVHTTFDNVKTALEKLKSKRSTDGLKKKRTLAWALGLVRRKYLMQQCRKIGI